MFRKTISMLLLTVLLFNTVGCGGMFSRKYYSEIDFQGNEELDLEKDTLVVQNYSELRREVFNMMNNHEESIHLLFSGYTGNVVSDTASVCRAVNTESAYGAYCVDYASYDLTQIVSYYEATIKISYRKTEDELKSMCNVMDMEAFGSLLASELAHGHERIVVKVNNGLADENGVSAYVQQTMRNHPMSISYMPTVALNVYTGNSSQKVYQVDIGYDNEMDNVQRLREMRQAVSKLSQGIERHSSVESASAAAEMLANHTQAISIGGGTAYDALVERIATSEGIACAYKALCDHLGIECTVVSGQMNKQAHFWNIIRLGDTYYHMDVSIMNQAGKESLFQGDADKQANCWWNQSDYPDCESTLIVEN